MTKLVDYECYNCGHHINSHASDCAERPKEPPMQGERTDDTAEEEGFPLARPMQGESEITPSEVQRRWDLPYDHPESWVQLNATYRQIYARGYERGIEDAAKVADSFDPNIWPDTIAAAIRSLSRK